jgi:WD40 repeat protein
MFVPLLPRMVPWIMVLMLLSTAHATVKVEHKVLVPPDAIATYVGPRGAVAAVVLRGSREVVVFEGADGPRMDRILSLRRTAIGFGGHEPQVAFSPDGRRHAYIGQQGDEYVIVVDGQEIARGMPRPGPFSHELSFSPGGRHVWYFTDIGTPSEQDHRLMINGKPATPPLYWSSNRNPPVFSPDDKRFAYAGEGRNRGEAVLAVDGKAAGYIGTSPAFTGDSRHLITSNGTQLLRDGRPLLTAAAVVGFAVAPSGNRVAAIIRPNADSQQTTLWLDGKEVPNTQGVIEFLFSPDGKRWAALGSQGSGLRNWVVLDGKRSPNYGNTTKHAFSADSQRFAYVAGQGTRSFIVVEDHESDPFQAVPHLEFAPAGHRLAFLARLVNGNHVVGVDDKLYASQSVPPVQTLHFSPRGTRVAFGTGTQPERLLPHVDGTPASGVAHGQQFWSATAASANGQPVRRFVEFSPDDKHVVYGGQVTGGREYGLFLDGKGVFLRTSGMSAEMPTFSPDSRHLFWWHRENRELVVYADGEPAVRLPEDRGTQLPHTLPGLWHMGEDGALRVLWNTPEGLKRYTITPSAGAGIARMLGKSQASLSTPAGQTVSMRPGAPADDRTTTNQEPSSEPIERARAALDAVDRARKLFTRD